MADASYTQTSFLGGEWSKVAQGNFDKPTYRIAMNVCLNGIPTDTGTWTRRPGFGYAGHTRGGAAARVVNFTFKQTAPYTIEFTNGYMRFRSGKNIVTTNDDAEVSAISTADPAIVTTGAAHGWSSGNQVIFKATTASDIPTLLQNRQFTITVTDTDKFSIADALTGTGIDGSTLDSAGATLTVARIMELTTPYTSQLWTNMRCVQTGKQAVLLQSSIAPRVLSVVTDPAASTYATFEIDTANFKDGPYLDPTPGNVLITPAAKDGNITLTVSFSAYSSSRSYSKGDFVVDSSVSYVSLVDNNVNHTPASSTAYWAVTSPSAAINNGDGFTAADIGRHIRLLSEPPIWSVGTSYTAGNVVAILTTGGGYSYWTCLTNHTANAQNAPGIDASAWSVNAAGALWSWGKITSLTNLISGTLSGSTNFGDISGGGGLAAAFDGNTDQDSSASATLNSGSGHSSIGGHIGKNYSGATSQKIASCTIWPSSDKAVAQLDNGAYGDALTGCSVYMYGSNSAPSNASDGTVIGAVSPQIYDNGHTTGPITITSSDQTTAYDYVWVRIVATYYNGSATATASLNIAEVQFISSSVGTGGASVALQLIGPALLYTSSIRTWRLGLIRAGSYPTCGTYHEGRLWLSGTVDNRLDASVAGGNDIFNFSPTKTDGTVADDNAISYTLDGPDVNAVFWMVPDQQGIIIGTQAGEWLVQATATNNPLTPTSMQAHRVTTIGCANIEPRRTEHTTIFVQRYGHKLMEYFPDVFSGKFSAPNLALEAKHLATRGLSEIAYQQELSPNIWARCSDGTLIGAAYKRETLMSSQGPTFIGWHRHTLGSGRDVESICGGPSSDGLLDTVTIVSNDADSNIRHVEVLENLWEEGSSLSAAKHLDDSVAPAYYQNVSMGGVSYLKLTGLWHLNGKTVSVFAGGLDLGDYTVSSGAVSVPYLPSVADGNFTTAFVSAFSGAMPVVVGFTFTSQGQIVRPAVMQDSGARNGPAFAKTRRVHKYGAQLVDTRGIEFGTSFSKMRAASLVSPSRQPLGATSLYSGIIRAEIDDDYSFDGMICWQITRPYPATLAAIGGFLHTQDI